MLKILRTIAIFNYLSLIILLFLWVIWLSPSTIFPKSLVLIALITPLLLPLIGILNHKPYHFAVACFIVLFYFMLGIGNIVSSNHPLVLSVLETGFSLVFFFCAAFYIKLSSQRVKNE